MQNLRSGRSAVTGGHEIMLCSLYGPQVVVMYIMEMLTILFRAKLTQGLADFWVAANAIKAYTKIVI